MLQVSGGPSLRSRDIPEITLLSPLICVPGGFRGVFLPPLKPPSPPISVDKCLIVRVVATIRGFVLSVSQATVFHNICRCSDFCHFLAQNGRFSYFSEIST